MLWPFLLEVFVNRLREIRVIKRISQFQLRLKTSIHQSKISLIENGLVKPREDERKRLAKALNVKLEEIWGTEDENTESIQE
jgi:transcriptional regulator with XRE-family HTH domain